MTRPITFLSDYGYDDDFVGVCHAVIARIAPQSTVIDLTHGTTVANLGFEEVTFPAPMFTGDTLHGESEVVATRESKSRPDQGIVTFEHRGFNQRDELVCRARRNALMHKRPADS